MSERLYINADEAKITYREFARVDLLMYDGREFKDLEPRRLFPLSGLTKYITLIDRDMKEVAIIRDLDHILPESRQALEKRAPFCCLSRIFFFHFIFDPIHDGSGCVTRSFVCF